MVTPLLLNPNNMIYDLMSPLHRGNRKNGQQNPLSGKTQGIWGEKHREKFAQVVNSLFLNIQDIAIFAAEFVNFSKSISHMKLSQISEIDTEKISSRMENTGKTQGSCK